MDAYSQQNYDEQCKRYGTVRVLNDIVSLRAADSPSAKILAFPRAESTGTDYYETFTAGQLKGFIDAGVQRFMALGYKPSLGRVVGLLGNTNVDYLVTMFALSRLGYAVVLLSLRLKPAAVANLLQATQADTIVHDSSATAVTTVKLTSEIMSISATPMLTRVEYGVPVEAATVTQFFTAEEQGPVSALVFHTSGSTGMPKPIHAKHESLAHSIYTSGQPLDTVVSRPLYHGWGHVCLWTTLYYGKTCYLLDTSQDLTTDGLVEALEVANAKFIPAVPNNLELLVKSPRGIACLKAADYVTTGGARIRDTTGDYLVAQGVNFSNSFGCSEATSCFGTSMLRPKDDPDWNFIEFHPIVQDHILLDPVGGGLYELVLLGTFPTLARSNTDHPVPGSYRSGDMMKPHPTKPRAWVFMNRDGDFIALATGEKVLGLPIEDRVRESPLVNEVFVVGNGKAIPSLLVVPVSGLADEEVLEGIWPFIETANKDVDQFSEIKKDKIYVLPASAKLPRTDKGNVIRPQLYTQFAEEIDSLYVH